MEISRLLGKFSALGTSFLSSHCGRVGLLNRIGGLQKNGGGRCHVPVARLVTFILLIASKHVATTSID